MIHLGFDPDLWGELMADYMINRMKCNIDFSVVHDNNDDMYSRFVHNLPKCLLTENVDVEVAIKDFLVKRDCLFVQWNDVSQLMNKVLDIKNSSNFILMLRRYIERYHPDLHLEWCFHSKMSHCHCDCGGGFALVPNIPRDKNISVSVLTLYSDYHLDPKNWWRMK